ncbi:hypothetical protein BROUX41_000451 [Berkeleyomyces rouxiae]|uniref:uncharacterized protein n=1 Tax=Berkeleyomyces rouxiae TaxID=2035830 RepID=UPI003B793537
MAEQSSRLKRKDVASANTTSVRRDTSSSPEPIARKSASKIVQQSQSDVENDDGDDNDDNLSPPPSDSISPPPGYEPATPKDDVPDEAVRHASPSRVVSDNEHSEETRKIASDDTADDTNTSRKRTSLNDDASETPVDTTALPDENSSANSLRRPGQTNAAKLILVGYWRSSNVPDDALKHSVVCFIDTRDRLRTRVQTMTRHGKPISAQYPMPHGGSWVPFEQIVFEDHLVGLDQVQIKEYVKIRTETLESNVVETDVAAAERSAVEKAVLNARYGPQPESGLPIAYGKEITERSGNNYSAPKRRRTDNGFVPLDQHPSGADSSTSGPIPFTSVGAAQNLAPLDPLPGTRPTRILIGYWHGSSEPLERDRHAIYGILGQNDMFRVKVVRETRDGRFVDGNFPSGAGALWIHYEEVVLEPHLQKLSRHEVKEYCRVRQWQIDHEEADEDRQANEAFAVQEAQARVAHGFRTGQITMVSKPPDDKVNLVPQISSGPPQYHQLRPAPSPNAHDEPRRSTGTRRSLPDSRAPAFRPINDLPNIPRPLSGLSRQLPPPSRSMRSSYGAPPPIDVQPVETSVASAASIASQAIAASTVGLPPPVRTITTPTRHVAPVTPTTTAAPASNGNRTRFGTRDEPRHMATEWGSPDYRRHHSLSNDDAIIYGGVKYEKKKAGPFKDRHVSQGNIISINGEDYVEYRVLTKPTFF